MRTITDRISPEVDLINAILVIVTTVNQSSPELSSGSFGGELVRDDSSRKGRNSTDS